MIYNKINELIGNTPIIKLSNIMKEYSLESEIFAKVEFFNPSSSIKDRAGLSMIEEGFKKGEINKDSTIIEPTSGNTGIALASICANMGLKLILTMPETMSIERRKILQAYGAEIVLTKGSRGMKGSIEKANELALEIKNSFIPSQFDNQANPDIHYKTTAVEILEDFKGDLDYFVTGVGTGGTLTGCGKRLKEEIKDIKVVAIEPKKSNVLSGGSPAPHGIQGIGAGFIPSVLDTSCIDEIITIEDEQAIKTSQLLARKEGILCGISSGASLLGAIKIAKKHKDKKILCILPDTGERYISTTLFDF